MREPIDGITISDNKKHSAEAMAKLASFTGTDLYPWGVTQTASNSNSISWSNGSSWTVDTAENADAGAGGTYHFAHCSETSKWPQTTAKNDVKTMTCLAPALSGMRTVMFSESTPEGATGWQFATWEKAITLDRFVSDWEAGIRPEEVWIKVFAAWFEFSSNQRQTPCTESEIEAISSSLSEHEKEEIRLYGLTWDQLAWRRETIRNKCNNDPKIFSYYYPSDDVTCWISSGSPRFDMGILVDMMRSAEAVDPQIGHLITQDNTRVSWAQQAIDFGDIMIWEHPRAGLSYLVVLDPATNKSQTVGADPDRHSLSVWRRGYFDQLSQRWRPAKRVARLRPPFYGEDDEVAGHAVRLSRYYGNAMVAMEVNIGQGILRLLQAANVTLYKRRAMTSKAGGNGELIYGFKMEGRDEREAIISGLASAILNREIDVSCVHALKEYKMFVRKRSGRAEAASGAHDDDVIADAIAWECLPSATPYQLEAFQHQDPPDRDTWRKVVGKW
jgi:hypothetical protein